jgi:AraC-like DNA-binding protein
MGRMANCLLLDVTSLDTRKKASAWPSVSHVWRSVHTRNRSATPRKGKLWGPMESSRGSGGLWQSESILMGLIPATAQISGGKQCATNSCHSASCQQKAPFTVRFSLALLVVYSYGGSLRAPTLFERTAPLIRQTDEDYYKVVIGHSGSTLLIQDGREAQLAAGDLAFYDSTRPYTFVMNERFDVTVCMLPKRLLPMRASVLLGVTATKIDAQDAIGSLLRPFIADLLDRCDDIGDTESDTLASAVGLLMSAAVQGNTPAQHIDNVHLLQAISYIDDHIAEPTLGPEQVAMAANVSLSYLHKIFGRTDNSISGTIRERRLQGCWADLTSSLYAHLTITAIGARWGLPDSAQFSRSFKVRFGVSPSEHRSRSLVRTPQR